MADTPPRTTGFRSESFPGRGGAGVAGRIGGRGGRGGASAIHAAVAAAAGGSVRGGGSGSAARGRGRGAPRGRGGLFPNRTLRNPNPSPNGTLQNGGRGGSATGIQRAPGTLPNEGNQSANGSIKKTLPKPIKSLPPSMFLPSVPISPAAHSSDVLMGHELRFTQKKSFADAAKMTSNSSFTFPGSTQSNMRNRVTGRPASLQMKPPTIIERADDAMEEIEDEMYFEMFEGDADPLPIPNRFEQMKGGREKLREDYIKAGKMAGGQLDLKDAITFVGECMDMCPEYERHERENHNGLDKLEKIPGTDNVDHSRAVKRFKRPAAGDPPPLPSDVRPPPVLMKTLNYLIYDVLANNGMDESYTFLRDRQRAIRSDFQLQNYRELEAVKAFELMARYSVMAQHRVATEEKALLSVKQEIDQMNMVLQSLSEFYEENARRGYFSPNEAEFRAYYILSHIWNPEVISLMEREVRPEVLFDPRVQHAMKIRATLGRAGHSSAHNGGSIQYAEFFRLVRDPSTTYLMACLMEMHFVAVRKAGFQAMQRAYYSFEDRGTWFPGDELMELMCFDNIDEVVETLEYYSIPVEIEGMGDDTLVWAKFGKIRSEGTMQRAQFEPDASRPLLQRMNHTYVEMKRGEFTEVDIVEGKGSEIGTASPVSATPPSRRLSSWATPTPVKEQLNYNDHLRATTSFSFLTTPKPSAPPTTTQPVSGFSFLTAQPTNLSFEAPAHQPLSNASVGQLNFFQHPQPTPPLFPEASPNIAPTPLPSTSQQFPFTSVQKEQSTFTTPAFTPPVSSLFPQPPKDTFTLNQTASFSSISIPSFSKPLPPPEPVVQRPYIPDTVADDILLTLLDEHVRNAVHEQCTGSLQEMQRRSGDLVARVEGSGMLTELASDLLVEVTDSMLTEVGSWAMQAWTDVSVEVARRVLEEAYAEMMFVVANEAVWEVEREVRILSRVWGYWTQKMKKRAERRASLQKRRRNFMENAKEVGAAGPTVTGWDMRGAKRRRKSGDVIDSRDLDQSLTDVFTKADERRQMLMNPLDLNAILSTSLSPVSTFWKLCICPPSNRTSEDNFRRAWIWSKFGPLEEDIWDESPATGDENTVTQIMRTKVGQNSVEILVQSVDVRTPAIYPLKHNAEAPLSGANAIIFALDSFPDGLDSPSISWGREREKLYAFLSCLPIQANVPLLLIVWTRSDRVVESLRNDVAENLNLNSIIEKGPVKLVELLYLPFTSSGDPQALSISFAEKLRWLAENSEDLPLLRCEIYQDLVDAQTLVHLATATRKVADSFPSDPMSLDLSKHVEAFDVLVDLFNGQVEAVGSVLADPSLIELAYPAKEQEGPHVPVLEWNTPTAIEQVASNIAEFQLPKMRVRIAEVVGDVEMLLEGPGPADCIRGIKRMYASYIAGLRRLPGITESAVSKVSRDVWHYLSAYEEQKAHRFPLDAIFESIATAILFTMEQRLSYSDRQYTRSPTHSTVHSPSDDTAPFFYLVAQIPVAANAFRRLSLELLSAWERRVREWSLATLNGWHTPPYSNGKQREAEITIPQLSPISVSFDTQVVSNRVNETSNGGTLSSGEISPPKNHYDQSFVNVSTSATGGGSLPKLSLTERLQQKIAAARMELKNSQSFDANVSI